MDKDATTGGWQFVGGMAVVAAGLLILLGIGWVSHFLPTWTPDPFGW